MYAKLPASDRERMARHVLTKVQADQSTMVNNILAERGSSRRKKVIQRDCNQAERKVKIKKRLLFKLMCQKVAALKEKVASSKNERKAKEENAEDLGRGSSEKKGKPKKTWSQTKKVLRENKCHTHVKK
jgi:hypothetical protein